MADSIRSAEDIRIADQIELRLADARSGEAKRYKSIVQDLTAEGIAVTMPEENRVPVPIPVGTAVVVAVWRGHADHLFDSRVLKRTGGRLPQLLLT